MTTLREWFREFTRWTGETPSTVVFGGEHNWHRDKPEWTPLSRWRELNVGQSYSWSDIPTEVLDREFDDGFGGEESPPLHAWSDSWVLYVHTYDGSEALYWVPRAPSLHVPQHDGYSAGDTPRIFQETTP